MKQYFSYSCLPNTYKRKQGRREKNPSPRAAMSAGPHPPKFLQKVRYNHHGQGALWVNPTTKIHQGCDKIQRQAYETYIWLRRSGACSPRKFHSSICVFSVISVKNVMKKYTKNKRQKQTTARQCGFAGPSSRVQALDILPPLATFHRPWKKEHPYRHIHIKIVSCQFLSSLPYNSELHSV